MKEAVIDTEENFGLILEACEKGGHSQVAAISTTRVPQGAVRVTILPNSSFKAGAVAITKEEWLAAFRDTIGQEPKRVDMVTPFTKSIDDRWYPMICKACGHRASSENFIEMPTGGDDCEVLCPLPECGSANTDEDYDQ